MTTNTLNTQEFPLPYSPEDYLVLAEVIEDARLFSQRQWLLGTSGNLSVRATATETGYPHQNQFYITRSGADKGKLTHSDFVQMGPGGQVLAPAGATGSAETLLHDLIYSRYPDVTAIYHVHTVTAAVVTMHCQNMPQGLRFKGLEMLKGLGAETHETDRILPVIANAQNMPELVPQVAGALMAQSPGFALQGHGVYAWGNSPAAARRHTEIWEYLLQYHLQCHGLNQGGKHVV